MVDKRPGRTEPAPQLKPNFEFARLGNTASTKSACKGKSLPSAWPRTGDSDQQHRHDLGCRRTNAATATLLGCEIDAHTPDFIATIFWYALAIRPMNVCFDWDSEQLWRIFRARALPFLGIARTYFPLRVRCAIRLAKANNIFRFSSFICFKQSRKRRN